MTQPDQAEVFDLEGITLRDIPVSLRAIARVAGLEPVLKLMNQYGGRVIYIPQDVSPQQNLDQLVGEMCFNSLRACYGGEMIYIPFPPTAKQIRIARDREIRSARAEGATVSSLARKHRLSMRTIRKITNQAP